MKNHLNIFEYYSQKGVLPIENNSTRNLGIVIKNSPIVLLSLIDLISKKSKLNIVKPTHPDEWFLELQVRIKNFAKEDLEISSVIAATLTTKRLDFYNDEESNEIENITDMIIYSKGTLIVIEAKRNDFDATNQLKRQITELKQEWENNNHLCFEELRFISLTWDDIIETLNNINTLTEGSNIILDNYIEHIKTRVPAFFPVQTINKLSNRQSNQSIQRRARRLGHSLQNEKRGETVLFRRLHRSKKGSERKRYYFECRYY